MMTQEEREDRAEQLGYMSYRCPRHGQFYSDSGPVGNCPGCGPEPEPEPAPKTWDDWALEASEALVKARRTERDDLDVQRKLRMEALRDAMDAIEMAMEMV